MTTVNTVEQWFDECAEHLVGLPVAEAVRDVMGAGLRVEVARPNLHRVRDAQQSDVSIVADRHGVVVDVTRIDTGPGRSDVARTSPRSETSRRPGMKFDVTFLPEAGER